VTAMLVESPSFVSVELGFAEVLGAATSGLVVPATAYGQPAGTYSYIPASVFAPVYAAIGDSVKLSKAKAVLFGVPRVTNLAGFRSGGELFADSAALAASGIAVSANCSGNSNLVFTAALVPGLAAAAQSSGTVQTLSCADVPGAVDYVLTGAEQATLNGSVDAMNVQIKALADQRGWAYVDANAVFAAMIAGRAAYRVTAQLTCVNPYGQYVSLDGIYPSLAGQQLLANAAAAAIDAKYGFAIPSVVVTPVTAAALCP
jgi:hypothetical protein